MDWRQYRVAALSALGMQVPGAAVILIGQAASHMSGTDISSSTTRWNRAKFRILARPEISRDSSPHLAAN